MTDKIHTRAFHLTNTPWTVETDLAGNPTLVGSWYEILDIAGHRVALVTLDPELGVQGTIRKARLIAAAPDLLSAGRALTIAWDSEEDAAVHTACDQVAHAVAIAEGRTKRPIGRDYCHTFEVSDNNLMERHCIRLKGHVDQVHLWGPWTPR